MEEIDAEITQNENQNWEDIINSVEHTKLWDEISWNGIAQGAILAPYFICYSSKEKKVFLVYTII